MGLSPFFHWSSRNQRPKLQKSTVVCMDSPLHQPGFMHHEQLFNLSFPKRPLRRLFHRRFNVYNPWGIRGESAFDLPTTDLFFPPRWSASMMQTSTYTIAFRGLGGVNLIFRPPF